MKRLARYTRDSLPASTAAVVFVFAFGLLVTLPGALACSASEVRAESGGDGQELGTLRVTARPWAKVEVNGQVWGTTPIHRDVPPGTYEVSLTKGNHRETRTVIVTSGEETAVAMKLGGEPRKANAPKKACSVQVKTREHVQAKGKGMLVAMARPWAKVTINGESRGTTPFTEGVPPGSYEVAFNKGGARCTQTVTVEPGQKVAVHAEFTP